MSIARLVATFGRYLIGYRFTDAGHVEKHSVGWGAKIMSAVFNDVLGTAQRRYIITVN
jgi:hypothetical protein